MPIWDERIPVTGLNRWGLPIRSINRYGLPQLPGVDEIPKVIPPQLSPEPLPPAQTSGQPPPLAQLPNPPEEVATRPRTDWTSMDEYRDVVSKMPEIPQRKGGFWRGLAAAAAGAAQGYYNAANPWSRPIDTSNIVREIRYPGYARRMAEYGPRIQKAQALAQIDVDREKQALERERMEAQAEQARASAESERAQAEQYRGMADYYRNRPTQARPDWVEVTPDMGRELKITPDADGRYWIPASTAGSLLRPQTEREMPEQATARRTREADQLNLKGTDRVNYIAGRNVIRPPRSAGADGERPVRPSDRKILAVRIMQEGQYDPIQHNFETRKRFAVDNVNRGSYDWSPVAQADKAGLVNEIMALKESDLGIRAPRQPSALERVGGGTLGQDQATLPGQTPPAPAAPPKPAPAPAPKPVAAQRQPKVHKNVRLMDQKDGTVREFESLTDEDIERFRLEGRVRVN